MVKVNFIVTLCLDTQTTIKGLTEFKSNTMYEAFMIMSNWEYFKFQIKTILLNKTIKDSIPNTSYHALKIFDEEDSVTICGSSDIRFWINKIYLGPVIKGIKL